MSSITELKITDIPGVSIGQVEDIQGGTGCTVFVSKEGMCAGLDVRGGGPASRESELLKPLASAAWVNAVVLSGGSAFGLDAAGGVMKCLEENGIGFDVGVTKVPLVCQSDLFDLTYRDPFARPDFDMGYAAAKAALFDPNYRDGNCGVGCGATVGKIKGMECCMKSGIGSYAIQIGDLIVGAVVAVNAFGDIYDWKTGNRVAGLLNDNLTGFEDTADYIIKKITAPQNRYAGNTTLGVIITNADFDKAALCKIAGMAHDGYARSIRPVHTSVDGDSIYALSVGKVEANMDVVGTVAADVMSEAILNAVMNAANDGTYKCARDIAG